MENIQKNKTYEKDKLKVVITEKEKKLLRFQFLYYLLLPFILCFLFYRKTILNLSDVLEAFMPIAYFSSVIVYSIITLFLNWKKIIEVILVSLLYPIILFPIFLGYIFADIYSIMSILSILIISIIWYVYYMVLLLKAEGYDRMVFFKLLK